MWITSSGYLQKSLENEKSFDYVMSAGDMFINWYNVVGVLWIIQFVIGCQHMIIAGCVATWFFARLSHFKPLIFRIIPTKKIILQG